MSELDNEAPAILARDSTYSLVTSSLTPSNLYIGEKVLIYLHPDQFKVFNNFWLVLISNIILQKRIPGLHWRTAKSARTVTAQEITSI